MHQSRLALVLLLSIVGGSISGLLLFDHHGVGAASAAVDKICGADEVGSGGCEEVASSAYSAVGGVSVAAMGLWFYGSMLLLGALALVVSDAARHTLAAIAFAAFALALATDAVLFAIQAFAIGAYCKLCLATYAVNAAALVVALPFASALASAAGALFGEAARPFSIWGLGSLVILVAVVATDRGFASTAQGAPAGQATLLGTTRLAPPPPLEPPETRVVEAEELEPESDPVAQTASPAPKPEPDPEESDPPEPSRESVRIDALEAELERVRARILELQATLDDPQKYQEYQMAQATQAFENAPVEDLVLEGIPFKGPESARVKVVEYSDFLCPYCRNLAGALSNYLPESNGNVAIYYKNYPLDQACNPALSRTIHDGACELALGAVCAQEQDKFWPYHDRVFAQPPPNPKNDDIVRIAEAAGLDGDQMRSCLDSGAASAALKAQIDEAQALNVTSTPTVYINGKKLEQISGFLQAIESELK